MDLGIAGKKALVCGASAGLGFACAQALVREGVEVVIVARTEAPLREAALALTALGAGAVHWVAADVTTAEGRARILAAHPAFDIVVTNAGGPPPGDFRQWDRDIWLKALDANMLAPIELIKATVDGMMARGFGRILNITSSAVKAPVDGLGLSNGARSGLTGFVSGLARSTVARGVTINNLLPGTFDTARLAGNFAAQAQREGRSVDDVRAARLAKHPAHRLGQPSELGATCAFLCSVHAGYINGQNVLLDGGSFAGV
ncbi:3-oxoacyl-ACP reductase [Limnohabitans sp. JirII-29]|uniref:SDR family oxidoreductase n=1 Tax=Limnohabitans sp. JirII-29 TaxID=1835756 RepID=UPI000D33B80D|nr:SDR family oxidoreductase [Limnohabitans sp. JirII-29]PUE29199.1 3-oxoacyl-ACP reductase [Limnohabitans sp. JirII-29]